MPHNNPSAAANFVWSPRPAGWAIASGITGILAIGGLIGYLVLRGDQTPEAGALANRLHDVGSCSNICS